MPYLYSDAEIGQLLQAAEHLPSPTGLRAHTYVAAFSLLAVTGMRAGELVGLDNTDVDLTRGHLTIQHGKCGKSRLLPLHPTTREALRHYVVERDSRYPIPQTPSFLVSEQGTRLSNRALRRTFVTLSRQIGLRGPTDSHEPRLHDFRHRLAVEVLLRYAEKTVHEAPSRLALEDPDAPMISAFLDHLQAARGTSARSRNVRLAAIHSFFQYAALQAPDHGGLIERVLAIPSKRYERSPIA